LPVIQQERNRGSGAVAKDVHGACERGVAQALATHGGSPIKTCAAVDRLGGHNNAAVGRAWDHARAAKKMRTTASSGGGSW
jgi:hypothetical protein